MAGQDPTNPVSFAFGSDYASHRTIVSLDDAGHFSYTPTINYGGNNGRAALLGSNGLYYTVVNAPQSPAGFVPAPDSGPAAGNVLPTLANAAQQAIVILNGFPTDSARAALADGTTGGDYTPFAVFFANDHTMYVTDEGTGNSADAAHAGLEKWILGNNGTWTLAYTLTNGLIGNVDSNLVGVDGHYPDVTTIGLRNLTGSLNKDGTVTLWARLRPAVPPATTARIPTVSWKSPTKWLPRP